MDHDDNNKNNNREHLWCGCCVPLINVIVSHICISSFNAHKHLAGFSCTQKGCLKASALKLMNWNSELQYGGELDIGKWDLVERPVKALEVWGMEVDMNSDQSQVCWHKFYLSRVRRKTLKNCLCSIKITRDFLSWLLQGSCSFLTNAGWWWIDSEIHVRNQGNRPFPPSLLP